MPAKDQGFSEDQIEDFKEVFQLFDTKGDGLIQVRSFSVTSGHIVSGSSARKSFSEISFHFIVQPAISSTDQGEELEGER